MPNWWHGWHTRYHVHKQHVSGRGFHGCLENYINQERISTEAEWSRKAGLGFLKKNVPPTPRPPLCVYLSYPLLTLTLPIHHHPHHVALVARISLTLSRHSSQSFIALGRSSGQHPVSSHSCWMYVRAGHPAFARPCVGVHKSTSLMSSSLLLQQCPACLVHLRKEADYIFIIKCLFDCLFVWVLMLYQPL